MAVQGARTRAHYVRFREVAEPVAGGKGAAVGVYGNSLLQRLREALERHTLAVMPWCVAGARARVRPAWHAVAAAIAAPSAAPAHYCDLLPSGPSAAN